MFKKLLLSSTILVIFSNGVLAATPYVGGSLGVTDLGIYKSGKVQIGAIGKLFGGYGSTYGVNNNIYLGGELNIDLAHYPNPYNLHPHNGIDYGLGISLIPGIMLTKDTMVYARIGIEANHGNNSSITSIGNQLGLGLQTNLTEHWAMRGEYIHTSNVSKSQLNLGLVYKFD